jgi:hypothetical protein
MCLRLFLVYNLETTEYNLIFNNNDKTDKSLYTYICKKSFFRNIEYIYCLDLSSLMTEDWNKYVY